MCLIAHFSSQASLIMLYLPRERGQGLVEYMLILVLVAVVVIVILGLLGPQSATSSLISLRSSKFGKRGGQKPASLFMIVSRVNIPFFRQVCRKAY